VTANCLHPGPVATSLFRNLPKPIEALIKLFTLSPHKGAETSVYLASSPAVEGVNGKYFAKKREKQTSSASRDQESARRLWDVSEQMTASRRTATNQVSLPFSVRTSASPCLCG